MIIGATACNLAGCVTYQPVPPILAPAPPYMLLPVDEMMTCPGIASSFQYSARRAALLEYWLSTPYPPEYGYSMFRRDAPLQLTDERRRLDALSGLQREKGCLVLDPTAAVVYERSKLEAFPPRPPDILHARG